jgi:murein DD-endopeptidase MepM/ murein hydrolase activator NlpD
MKRLGYLSYSAALVLGLLVLAGAARPAEAVGTVHVEGVAAADPALDSAPSGAAEAAETCPPGTLPDGTVCVHLPEGDDEGSELAEARNGHHVRSGAWTEYDQIPRLPERPADYGAYRYPTPPGLPGGRSVLSGYDLDRPDESQRRGRTLRAVGHGGVDLPNRRGTPVQMVALEHQQGDADVLFTGTLFGTTVVTRHVVREAGQLREYVVLFGHLDSIAPGVTAGSTLKDGDPVGGVGDTGSPELVHLHYEVRRVRDGVDLAAKVKSSGAGVLVENEVTVVCDPRNVLPLR